MDLEDKMDRGNRGTSKRTDLTPALNYSCPLSF